VIISWTDRSNNEAGFQITRATNAAFTTGVTTFTVGANVTTYTDASVAPLTQYWYRVNAFNAAGNSGFITGTVTTRSQLPAVPTSLTVAPPAAPAGRTTLTISWAYTTNGAPGPITYQVQRSNTGTGGWANVATGLTTTTFTNGGLPVNTLRYYRVRAVNAAGNSAWTTVVSGRTLP
jgi:predicted phage tail protein